MDSNQAPMSKQNDHLGINRTSKNIKKSPLHQPNFPNPNPNLPQPQVYNVNKNDFRDIVQQLTGSPLREPLPRPPHNNPKPPNNRLQRVRPPPLIPTARPHVPLYSQVPVNSQPRPLNNVLNPNNVVRPPNQPQFHHSSPNLQLPPTPNDVWSNTNESPVSAYARYLQNSIMDSGPQQGQPQNVPQPQVQPHYPVQNAPGPHHPVPPPPNYPAQNVPPPPHYPVRNGRPPQPLVQPRFDPNQGGPPVPGPRVSGPYHMPPASPRGLPPQANLASPTANVPSPLLSPTSQYILNSPTGFLNLSSPRSPYPLLSPGYQNPLPRSPNFSFSSIGPPGNIGQGPNTPPPPPTSGFFPLSSPRWRSQ